MTCSIDSHQVLTCLGSGGVGKTSLAAALGLRAAKRGRDAVVVTIDPARRLAGALGLEALADRPEPIELGPMHLGGRLSAMMLAQKPAWDRLIARHAPSAESRDRILSNRFYELLSSSLAGAHEYAAIDVVLDLVESGPALVVLDTPPARHALDFFRAPGRARAFLKGGAINTLLTAYRGVPLGRWAAWGLSRVRAVAGAKALADVADFFDVMTKLAAPLAARARAMEALLLGDRVGHLLITTADSRSERETLRFASEMKAIGLTPRALIMNRSATPCAAPLESITPRLERLGLDRTAAAWVAENVAAHRRRAEAEARGLDHFASALGAEVSQVRVPELEGEVHDLASLSQLSERLDCAITSLA